MNEMKFLYIFALIFEHYVLSLNLLFYIQNTQKDYLLYLFINTVYRYINDIFTIIIFVYIISSFLFYQRNINN